MNTSSFQIRRQLIKGASAELVTPHLDTLELVGSWLEYAAGPVKRCGVGRTREYVAPLSIPMLRWTYKTYAANPV